MVKLSGMLSRFRPVRILVIGDFMLDTYTTGKVKRISPEAPVSVLHVEKEEERAGGAGNVVLNFLSLGAQVDALGRVGKDAAGEHLLKCLAQEGVNVRSLFVQQGYQTPVKNRLIADAQQVLRVDFESAIGISDEVEGASIQALSSLLDEVDIVAISDYGKGFLSKRILEEVFVCAKHSGVPVIVDPKGSDFTKYRGATLIKPNLQEAYQAAKLPSSASLEEVAAAVFQTSAPAMLLITRSESGISLFTQDGVHEHFPVRSKEVKDVTGAGDTVLAMLSVALANKIDIHYAVQLANIAAGMAIERLGCARISLSEIAERLLEYDVENKIFDEEHLFALQQVLRDKKFILLGVDSSEGMTTSLFRGLRAISVENPESRLIVYVRDSNPCEEFVLLLSSLGEVDFIVLHCESLKNLCEIIHPHQVFVADGGVLVALDHPDALLLAAANQYSRSP